MYLKKENLIKFCTYARRILMVRNESELESELTLLKNWFLEYHLELLTRFAFSFLRDKTAQNTENV
jgi:hypothetical protein